MTVSNPQAHVVVVDDESINLTVMKLSLEEKQMRVSTFESGAACLENLKESNPANYDCVVTDHSMPGMTGLELLESIKSIDPTLEVIVVTGENERKIIQEALRKGAYDFLDKPLDPSKFFNTVTGAIKTTTIRRKRNATEASLIAARSTGLFAEFDPDQVSLPINRIYAPKHELGGDFIDIHSDRPNQTNLILGDISGHDIQSALLSSHFLGSLQGWRSTGTPFHAEELLSSYNRFLIHKREQEKKSHVVRVGSSLSICAIEQAGDTLRLSNCGIPPVFIFYRDGSLRKIEPQHQPLGWFDIETFQWESISVSTISGMLLLTDGLVEHAKQHRCDPLSIIFHLNRLNKAEQQEFLLSAEDDILIVSLQWTEGDSTQSALVFQEYRGNELSKIDRFQMIWKNSVDLAIDHLDEHRRHRFILACREAVINALKHGCKEAADLSASIQIHFDADTRILSARIQDPGGGHEFNYEQRNQDLEHLNPGNLGLVLISKLVDEMTLDDQGSSLSIKMKV